MGTQWGRRVWETHCGVVYGRHVYGRHSEGGGDVYGKDNGGGGIVY